MHFSAQKSLIGQDKSLGKEKKVRICAHLGISGYFVEMRDQITYT